MDLQAILDASDDSSIEENNEKMGLHSFEQNHNQNLQSDDVHNDSGINTRIKNHNRTRKVTSSSTAYNMDMDLERILRENDDSSTGSSIDMKQMLPAMVGKYNEKPQSTEKNQIDVDVNYFNHDINHNDVHSIANTTISTNIGHHLNKSSQHEESPRKSVIKGNIQSVSIKESLPLTNVDENFYGVPNFNHRLSHQTVVNAEHHHVYSEKDAVSPLENEERDIPYARKMTRKERNSEEKEASSSNHTTNINHHSNPDHYSQNNYINPEKVFGVHDPEDWAVLQAILSEADDSEDEGSNPTILNHRDLNNTYTSSASVHKDFLDQSKKKLFTDPSSSIMERLLLEDNFDYEGYDNDDDITGLNTRLSSQTMSDYTLSSNTGGTATKDAFSNGVSLSQSSRHLTMSSSDVDAILQSVGDISSDEDGEGGANTESSNRLNKKLYKNLHKDDDINDFNDIVKNIQQASHAALEAKFQEKAKIYDDMDEKTDVSPISPRLLYENNDPRCPAENDLDENGTSPSQTISSKMSNRQGTDYSRNNMQPNNSQKKLQSEELSALALQAAENYEIRLLRPGQRDIISPLMVKRRMKPKIELPTRSRLQARQQKQKQLDPQQTPNQQLRNHAPIQEPFPSLSSQSSKFDISGVIQSTPLPGISSELYKNSQMRRHSVGLPTALTFNSKFIAIGTQRGIILVFDLFETLRQQLGKSKSSDNNPISPPIEGSVTSMDLSADAETLISGYTSGVVALWDVIRGSLLKHVHDVHPSPITSVRFLSDRETSIVSVDAGGLVNKLGFSKSMIWSSSYGVETECLLDGTAGQILAISVLAPLSTLSKSNSRGAKPAKRKSQHHPSVHKLKLIALSSERSSFAVAVEPSVNVLHRWPRPSTEQIHPHTEENQENNSKTRDKDDNKPNKELPKIYLPCLVWGWGLVSGMGHSPTPILARAWGSCLQLLLASFPEIDPSDSQEEVMLWPAFGIHEEFDTSDPVVALEWLGERSLVYLTVTNEFTVIDTVMMTLLERLDFSAVKLVYAEFSLSRSSEKSTGKSAQSCSTFQNSFRSNDNRLLVLCQEEAKSLCILGARRRVSSLEEDGEWLEALALALDHYESSVKSLEDKQREKGRNLTYHPEFSRLNHGGEDDEWIADLLMRYLKLAVENAPESSHMNVNPAFRSSVRIDLAKSHFQMLAGVCIEFCVVTRRLDLLFGEIFRRFQSVRYTSVFLDVLEPYVLNDKLHYIAPEAMAQFVEHCKASNDVATVERCLLHMDVTILDFDSILSLLRKNGMYSALIHVFTHGLDDFITPLEILMEGVFDASEEYDLYASRRNDGIPQSLFEQYGYKAILYIKYCFQGKTFPQGNDIDPEERVDSLRQQVLSFLLQMTYNPSRSVSRSNMSSSSFRSNLDGLITGKRSEPHPYLHVLALVDAKAVLDALSLALDAPGARFAESKSKIQVMGGWSVEVDVESSHSPLQKGQVDNYGNRKRAIIDYDKSGRPIKNESSDSTLCPDRQLLVGVLSSIILPMAENEGNTGACRGGAWQIVSAKNAFLDFMAKYLLAGVVAAPKSLTFSVLSRMSDCAKSVKIPSARRVEQEKIIALLEVLPTHSFDREEVLEVVESARITRAALLLHKEAVNDYRNGGNEHRKLHHKHFIKAIECYLQDENDDFKREVYQYVKNQCTESSIDLTYGGPTKSDILRNSLCKKIPDLILLDAVLLAQFVAEVYVEDLDYIISSLSEIDSGQILFKFLHAIISDGLSKTDSVANQVLKSNLSIDHHQKYLSTMAQFHPEMVYHHLSSHDNYRPDECLKLCQEYEIADASAYLLERTGNVSSALQLMLQTLEGRMMTLKRVIRTLSDSSINASENQTRWRKGSETKDTNSNKVREIDGVKQILIVALDLCERNSGPAAKTEHGSQLWFNVLDRLINAKGFLRLAKELPKHAEIMSKVLSELLQLTMQRMVSNVPLPDLVHKITTDHAGNRLGEFREMIFSMLKTYSLELDVFSNAAEVMYQDLRVMSVEKRNLKIRGLRTQSVSGVPLGHNKLGKESKMLDCIPESSFVSISSEGNAVITTSDVKSNVSRVEENVFKSTRSRLHRKRSLRRQNNSKKSYRGQTKQSLSLMTLDDRCFPTDEFSSANYVGERFVGILSGPEHVGRFG